MRPVSTIKIVGSAFLIAGVSTALIFAVAHAPIGQRLAADAVTATASAPQAPPVRSDVPSAVTEAPAAGPAAQVQTALAAFAANSATLSTDVGRTPESDGVDQASPSFDIARVEADGDAVIAGRAAPGSIVDLLRNGQRVDGSVADAAGEFVIISPRLPAGSYELTLSAKSPDGAVSSSRKGVLVTVNDPGPSARLAQPSAGDLSGAASKPREHYEPHSPTDKAQENSLLRSMHSIHSSLAADESGSTRGASRVVSRGDSLWRISRTSYGDGAQYTFVYQANRERIRDPNLIFPGQTLLLPVKRK